VREAVLSIRDEQRLPLDEHPSPPLDEHAAAPHSHGRRAQLALEMARHFSGRRDAASTALALLRHAALSGEVSAVDVAASLDVVHDVLDELTYFTLTTLGTSFV
jgi:hypothetical protein